MAFPPKRIMYGKGDLFLLDFVFFWYQGLAMYPWLAPSAASPMLRLQAFDMGYNKRTFEMSSSDTSAICQCFPVHNIFFFFLAED